MTALSKLYDDFSLLCWNGAEQPSKKQQWMQKLWSRDPAFLKTIQEYADEKLTCYNQQRLIRPSDVYWK
jgi:hypothetical protein